MARLWTWCYLPLASAVALIWTMPMAAMAQAGADKDLVILTDDYFPYTSTGSADGGVVLDLISQAFALQQIKVIYRSCPWQRCQEMVADGKAFAATPFFDTPERRERFDYSAPIIFSVNRFFYNKEKLPQGLAWQSLEDFKPYRMGGVIGYWYLPEFERQGLKVDLVRSDRQNFARLIRGRIDFTLLDEFVGMQLLKNEFPTTFDKIGMLDKPESFIPLHLLISRDFPDNKELTQVFDTGLARLIETGQYAQTLEKHGFPAHFAVKAPTVAPR
jgi:polar amino acid transport system substrate-binding protein